MLIRLSGDVFKISILELMQNAQKTVINFKLTDNILTLQVSGTVTNEKVVTVFEYDDFDNSDFSIELDQTVNLIIDKEPVTIQTRAGIVEITQEPSFSMSANILHEQRVEIDSFGVEKNTDIDKDALIKFIDNTKALDTIAKVLSNGIAPINVFDGVAYQYYSNTVYVDKLDIPDCSISSEVLRKLRPILSRASSNKARFEVEKSMCYFEVSKTEVASIGLGRTNISLVKGVKDHYVNTQEIAKVNMRKYRDYMDVVVNAYKKINVELSICDDGIRLFIDNATTKFSIGSRDNSIVSTKLSIAQLVAINKLFGEIHDVTVRKGANCLCFQQTNSEKKLIVAGMLY